MTKYKITLQLTFAPDVVMVVELDDEGYEKTCQMLNAYKNRVAKIETDSSVITQPFIQSYSIAEIE